MPALSSHPVLHTPFDGYAPHAFSLSSRAVNASSSDPLQVVCAWPVSGQYGPGSRVLYYVLVATCIFARKRDWLKNACLAATLLFPAVAALHSIVLAAMHIRGAVDMDIYGAFQFCTIGILAAPVTVRLSQTYFNDPGRNAIFLWTSLVLAGLLSLTVEFYRTKSSDCTQVDGIPISSDLDKFPYGKDNACGLTCSIDSGPHSPLRGGSANNIYVIPAPDRLTFGAATLLAAACCIPAILSLISMWNKIVENKWKPRFGDRDEEDRMDEAIEGTNGATIRKMREVNDRIKSFLEVIGIPLFGGAVLAILIVGERNLFSYRVRYQTEPMASIGQWAPIAGTGFAALGSLYLLLSREPKEETTKQEAKTNAPMHYCNCSHHHHTADESPPSHYPSNTDYFQSSRDGRASDGEVPESPAMDPVTMPPMQEINRNRTTSHPRHIIQSATGSQSIPDQGHQDTSDPGNRIKVERRLTKISNFLTNAGADFSKDEEFKHGKALDFPEIPGEQQRNPDLNRIREQYNTKRHADENITPALSRQRSRAGSFSSNISAISGLRVENPTPSPSNRASFESQQQPAGDMPGPPPPRRSTLEVPQRAQLKPPRSRTIPQINTNVPGGLESPRIVVSPDETDTPATPAEDQPTPHRHTFRSSSEPLPPWPPLVARGSSS